MANKEELIEIKKGKLGRGLLIESDGYISLDMKENRQLKESIEESGEEHWHVPKNLVVSALLQRCNAENHNGRIYPEEVLRPEVEKYQQKIQEHRALAELNHPSESTIDLDRIAINVVECHWEGNNLVGKIEFNTSYGFRKYGIVSTKGDQTVNLLMNGYKIGVSSRGVGEVEEKFGKVIVSSYELICFDVVSDPSTNNAWIAETDEEISQYLESKKNEKPVISEKKNKIDKLLDLFD